MSAPVKRRGRAASANPTASKPVTTLFVPESTATDDAELDRQLVDGVDSSLWAALFAGEFRLAVKCSRCGRWLTAGPSKRAGIGSHCAAQAGLRGDISDPTETVK